MKFFELPLLDGKRSVADALAVVIDAGVGGVVVRDALGVYRIVAYAALAAAKPESALKGVAGEAAPKVAAPEIASPKNIAQFDFLRQDLAAGGPAHVKLKAATKALAVLAVHGALARCFALSESMANKYLMPSTGFHCKRTEGKPHYYPPNKRNPANPQVCIVCSSALP